MNEAAKCGPLPSTQHVGDTLHIKHCEALADFNAALVSNPCCVPALAGRGAVCRALRRHSRALKDYNDALRLPSSSCDF